MSAEVKKEIALEIAHVLFIDIVGYSNFLIDEQRALIATLNEIVRKANHFRNAEAAERLLKIPSGDGMALVFYQNLEAPLECAMEISEALTEHPEIPLRMGIHCGPVSGVVDVNDRANVAGAGINIARRVMDCGDAGHILLSKHAAEDLESYGQWRPHLHDLGECEVKPGAHVHIVNFWTEKFGNREVPRRLQESETKRPTTNAAGSGAPTFVRRWALVVSIILLLLLALGARAIWSKRSRQLEVAPSSAANKANKSIAVLPFENLSAEKENAYFADGVQDEIMTNLAKIADLKVISRTSSMQYKSRAERNIPEIGKQLGVSHLLEGSVQRIGDKVRVHAQLIDARTNTHIWAQTYDRALGDVFAIQSDIAKTIADQLKATISPGEQAAIEKAPTTNFAAYDLYLRAAALYADTTDAVHAKEKLPQAARILEEAIALDPKFLLAWCVLSKVHGEIYFQGLDHTPARLALANQAVQRALRFQPDAGEAHLALANYYYHGFRDYDRARSELAIAQRTLPNNAEVFEYSGYIDRREGHWAEATRNLERALELDPRNFLTLQQLALAYQAQRRYADEGSTYDRALTIVPADPLTRILRAGVEIDWHADIGPYERMLATLIAEDPAVAADVDDFNYALCGGVAGAARALKNYPADGLTINGVHYPHSYWEGVVARLQNDSEKGQTAFAAARSEVEKMIEKHPEFAGAFSLQGMIDAGLGRKEEAIREGRRACELLPITKDSTDGVAFAVNLAQIYAWIGEKDLAIEQIEAVERVPNFLSYGYLKLQPLWDSLRGDPQFEQIVASLAPK